MFNTLDSKLDTAALFLITATLLSHLFAPQYYAPLWLLTTIVVLVDMFTSRDWHIDLVKAAALLAPQFVAPAYTTYALIVALIAAIVDKRLF